MGREWIERKNDIEITIKAKLIESLDNNNYNDGQHFGVVMKYELLEIKKIKGGSPNDFPYSIHDILYIIHGVPELPRIAYHRYGGSLEYFRELDIHLLRLKVKNPNNNAPFDIVIDPYINETKEKRYLCIQVDSVSERRQWIEFFTF